MTLEAIRCSPSMIIVDVASLMRVRAKEKGLFFEVHYQTPIPETIQSDPTRIRQVLMNLVGNAIKFTASGGIRILARCEGADTDAPTLTLEVVDTGIGMSPAQITQLFQPFVQADTSTTRKFGGTGLGLAICRRLAHMLGGDIRCDSSPGRGSSSASPCPRARSPASRCSRSSRRPASPRAASRSPSPRRTRCSIARCSSPKTGSTTSCSSRRTSAAPARGSPSSRTGDRARGGARGIAREGAVRRHPHGHADARDGWLRGDVGAPPQGLHRPDHRAHGPRHGWRPRALSRRRLHRTTSRSPSAEASW